VGIGKQGCAVIQVTPGQANTVEAALVAKATGSAITSGVVTFQVMALSGSHAGKWWSAATSAWSAVEASAGTATYKGGATWTLSIAAGAWAEGVRYALYPKESGGLHIPYDVPILAAPLSGGSGSEEFTVTCQDGDGNPLDGVAVWISTDEAGGNVVAGVKYTSATGKTVFKIDAGTYWVHRQLSGYDFDPNPAQATVS
jgi:hypothetical protein